MLCNKDDYNNNYVVVVFWCKYTLKFSNFIDIILENFQIYHIFLKQCVQAAWWNDKWWNVWRGEASAYGGLYALRMAWQATPSFRLSTISALFSNQADHWPQTCPELRPQHLPKVSDAFKDLVVGRCVTHHSVKSVLGDRLRVKNGPCIYVRDVCKRKHGSGGRRPNQKEGVSWWQSVIGLKFVSLRCSYKYITTEAWASMWRGDL